MERSPGVYAPVAGIRRASVNDHTSDEGRSRLAELIPSVIGLTGDDLHIDAVITLRCATIALPVAAGADRQRVLAVSILVCERVLAQLDGRPRHSFHADTQCVLAAMPQAAQWAERFTRTVPPWLPAFRRQAAPHVRCAVESAAHAPIPDPDDILRRMLIESITVCAAWTGKAASGTEINDAAKACQQIHQSHSRLS